MNRYYITTFLISIFLIVVAFFFQEKLSQFRSLGLLGIFLINFFGSATIFLPAPAIASVVAGGWVYPPLAVAIVSALGATIGDMVGFLLGHSGKDILLKRNHRWYVVLKDMFQKFGNIIIFLFAFVPNPVFDGIGIFAGALAFSPRSFFIYLFAGRLLRNILLAYVGSAVGGE